MKIGKLKKFTTQFFYFIFLIERGANRNHDRLHATFRNVLKVFMLNEKLLWFSLKENWGLIAHVLELDEWNHRQLGKFSTVIVEISNLFRCFENWKDSLQILGYISQFNCLLFDCIRYQLSFN